MTKLDKLIQKFCPDGVEYKELSEIFNTRNGYTPSKNNKKYWENGTIPWLRMEDIRTNGRILSSALQTVTVDAVKGKPFPADSIIVATSATVGEHAMITVESLANQRFTYLMLKPQYQTSFTIKFLYYYCFKLDQYCLGNLNQGNFASVDMKKFAKFKFPIPPLPVQEEIVRILDTFTELTTELTTELNARKKQYEYYSVRLFEHITAQSTLYPLSKLGKWSGGKTPSMANKEFWTNGTIPWISSKDMKTSCMADTEDHITIKALTDASMTLYPAGCTAVVTRSGILKHTFPVSYIPFETTVNQDIKILSPNPNILPRYAYLIISAYSEEIRTTTKKQGGTVDSLDFNKVLNFKVPVPPLAEQERIVSILDRFDTLCNDLTSGLPAEIEARKKQYEYYRDKLLSFQPIQNS